MTAFYQQVSSIITTPPGNLTYHLIIAFSVAWALQAAFTLWRGMQSRRARRIVIGLGFLLLLRLALFLLAGIAGQGIVAAEAILPPADRAAAIAGLIVMIWLWGFPESHRYADAAALLLMLAVFIWWLVSLLWWGGQSQKLNFNESLVGFLWDILAVLLILVGGIIVVLRRKNSWGVGLGVLALSFFGHLISLLFPLTDSDYAGAIRLSQMMAYPLLFSLPQALMGSGKGRPERAVLADLSDEAAEAIVVAPRFTQNFLRDWLVLEKDGYSEGAQALLARFLCRAMGAGTCVLLSKPNQEGELAVIAGFDASKDRPYQNFPLQIYIKQIPLLSNALERNRPMRLPAENKAQDLTTLKDVLHLDFAGHVLAAPLTDLPEANLFGTILMRTDQHWTTAEQTQLTSLVQILAQMTMRSRTVGEVTPAFKETIESAQAAAQQITAPDVAALERVLAQSQTELDEETQQAIARLKQQNEELKEALVRVGAGASKIAAFEQRERDLRAELEDAKKQEAAKSQELEQVKEEFRLALSEIDRFKAQIADLEQQLARARDRSVQQLSSEQIAEIASTIQELSHPMATIVDYIDLLLDESVGVLGALQRKFLERIKTSITELEELINQLIQTALLDSAKYRVSAGVVDVGKTVKTVLDVVKPQIQERKIKMKVTLPKPAPVFQADEGALQEILTQLVHNALIASPLEGEVKLRVRLEERDGQKHLLFQVTDSGEGISSEEMPLVFTRLYRVENVPVRGVGDSGIGLTIAKTLVEAMKGHIWVDSEVGSGSTFSFLLPFIEAEDADS